MKKNQFFCFMAIFFFAAICFSCNKLDVITPPEISDNDNQKRNEATWIFDNNSKGWFLKLLYFSGHDISQCGGKCIKAFGDYGHIDCRGFGDACANAVRAIISSNGDGFYTITFEDAEEFGDDLEYLFPDRSFFITNPQNPEELWLNIQEQLLLRDSLNHPFIVYDAWFSEEQELENR